MTSPSAAPAELQRLALSFVAGPYLLLDEFEQVTVGANDLLRLSAVVNAWSDLGEIRVDHDTSFDKGFYKVRSHLMESVEVRRVSFASPYTIVYEVSGGLGAGGLILWRARWIIEQLSALRVTVAKDSADTQEQRLRRDQARVSRSELREAEAERLGRVLRVAGVPNQLLSDTGLTMLLTSVSEVAPRIGAADGTAVAASAVELRSERRTAVEE